MWTINDTMKTTKAYNVQIWVGLKETYGDQIRHTIDDVRKVCDEWVNTEKDCVSITPTEYRYVGGSEIGVVVGMISYPRFPREHWVIRNRAVSLAQKLMYALNQYKVTVTTPKRSYMLENEKVKRDV